MDGVMVCEARREDRMEGGGVKKKVRKTKKEVVMAEKDLDTVMESDEVDAPSKMKHSRSKTGLLIPTKPLPPQPAISPRKIQSSQEGSESVPPEVPHRPSHIFEKREELKTTQEVENHSQHQNQNPIVDESFLEFSSSSHQGSNLSNGKKSTSDLSESEKLIKIIDDLEFSATNLGPNTPKIQSIGNITSSCNSMNASTKNTTTSTTDHLKSESEVANSSISSMENVEQSPPPSSTAHSEDLQVPDRRPPPIPPKPPSTDEVNSEVQDEHQHVQIGVEQTKGDPEKKKEKKKKKKKSRTSTPKVVSLDHQPEIQPKADAEAGTNKPSHTIPTHPPRVPPRPEGIKPRSSTLRTSAADGGSVKRKKEHGSSKTGHRSSHFQSTTSGVDSSQTGTTATHGIGASMDAKLEEVLKKRSPVSDSRVTEGLNVSDRSKSKEEKGSHLEADSKGGNMSSSAGSNKHGVSAVKEGVIKIFGKMKRSGIRKEKEPRMGRRRSNSIDSPMGARRGKVNTDKEPNTEIRRRTMKEDDVMGLKSPQPKQHVDIRSRPMGPAGRKLPTRTKPRDRSKTM